MIVYGFFRRVLGVTENGARRVGHGTAWPVQRTTPADLWAFLCGSMVASFLG